MIADSNFISEMIREQRRGVAGRAGRFFSAYRMDRLRTSVISVGEIMILFPTASEAWRWMSKWQIYRLHIGIVEAAAEVDREQIKSGLRLGENDNWIAGFARYHREPLISRDAAFDRVEGLRRMTY
jgi:predicted nucleic acid-binding protein